MKKILKKIKSVLTSAKTRGAVAANMACLTLMTSPVFAANRGNGGNGNNGNPTSQAKDIANILVKIFPLMGGFFALSGVIKWVMAFRSEQPEQQASAVKEIIIGVVCIVFGSFLWDPISNIVFAG